MGRVLKVAISRAAVPLVVVGMVLAVHVVVMTVVTVALTSTALGVATIVNAHSMMGVTS